MQGNASPSAKLSVGNEAMYFFHIAPLHFRNILFVLEHSWRDLSLASQYLKTYEHMVLTASNSGSSTKNG
jgi:hypothetical protein